MQFSCLKKVGDGLKCKYTKLSANKRKYAITAKKSNSCKKFIQKITDKNQHFYIKLRFCNIFVIYLQYLCVFVVIKQKK